MKIFIIALLIFFAHSFCCYAQATTNEELAIENAALKRELEELKQQLSTFKDSVAMPALPKPRKEEFIREPISQDSTPSVKAVNEDLGLSASSTDEEIEEDIEEIVVTATRTKQSIKDVGSAITLITEKEIKDSKSPLVLDVLRQVPGLEVTRTQGIGGTTSIFIRGGNSAHTLVFVDGVQVNSTTSGSFDFANLTTDNIEKVEVLRGPQSTLYGSEAIGGVINIFTKKGKGKTSIAIGTEYGTHETYREKINLSGGEESFDYSMGLSYLKTHGISNASSGREEDNYENFTGTARIGYDFMDDGRVDTTLRVSHSDFELDGFTFPIGPTDGDHRQKTDEVFFSTKVQKTFFDIWTPSILVSVNDTELEGFDPTIIGPLAGTFDAFNIFRIPARLWRAEHQSNIDVTDFDTVTLGFEYEVQEGENEGTFAKKTLYNRGAFFQNQIKLFDRINWTAGLRYDRHSEFGVHYTYRSALSLDLDEIGARMHGSWGKGFRAPSINELFFPNFGNPSLDPEESKGWDIGMEKEIIEDKLRLDVTYFENDFTDLIVVAIQPDGSFIAQNVGKAQAAGYETTLTFRPNKRLSLMGTYTYIDTKDRDKNDDLPRRPRNRATMSLNVQPTEKLNLNLTGVSVRDRIDSDGTEMDDYWIANFVARYDITSMLTGYVRFENLFDRDYEEVTGFDSLDLTMYAGFDFKF